jgi:parallel beta-helix repeat protein
MKRICSIALALVPVLGFTLVMAVPVAAATTWYVDDDNCPGPGSGSVGDPFCTIQTAVSAASSGDTIYVHAGTYFEHVTIDKSLTLQGEDRNTTIVDGSESGNVIYVTANYVTICGLTATNGEYGIYLISNWSIHHITIRDVIITLNSQRGFQAPHSGGYHLIEDCIISNNGGASYAHQFGNSIIRNCEVFGNSGGLSVAWGSGTLIANNKVHNNTDGIWFDSMSYSTIEKNHVYNNLGSGIGVGYVGHHNTIRDNIVHHNGLGIYMNSSNVIGNKVYHNDVIANTLQAWDKDNNIWDNGYPSGGNYWSDYAGVDDFSGAGQNVPGSDGIGDTPYTFSGGQDNYPLMEARRTKCVATATGTGTACFTTGDGVIEYVGAVTAPPNCPAALPHGLFSFNITGLTPGQNVTITVELPDPVPVGTKWWKYQNGSWYSLDLGSDDGDNTITVVLQDGVFPGDEDSIAGQITDDGGPGTGSVGWETYPIDKLVVMAPWIALFGAIVAGALIFVRHRRAQS